jgi:hypothetical protein
MSMAFIFYTGAWEEVLVQLSGEYFGIEVSYFLDACRALSDRTRSNK